MRAIVNKYPSINGGIYRVQEHSSSSSVEGARREGLFKALWHRHLGTMLFLSIAQY